MLHQDMMFRFNRELDLTIESASQPATIEPAEPPRESRRALVLSVAGNTVAGSLFLGTLILLPYGIERLLALL